jgi:hypothetical protein
MDAFGAVGRGQNLFGAAGYALVEFFKDIGQGRTSIKLK